MRKPCAWLLRHHGPGKGPTPGFQLGVGQLRQGPGCPAPQFSLWPREGAQGWHTGTTSTPPPLTVEALHFRLLALGLLLKALGLATLLAVEHEAQHSNDVGHSSAHGQPDGLDHLVGGRAAQAL